MKSTTAMAGTALPPAAARLPDELRPVLALTLASLIALLWLLRQAELEILLTAPGTIAFAVTFVCLAVLAQVGARSSRAGLRLAGRIAGYYLLFTIICLIGAVGSYPVAALSHGYVDGALDRADRILGFDWVAWYRTVAAHPLLQSIERAAYQSIFVSPAILLAHFARENLRADAARFLMTVCVAEILTLALYWQLPAVGPFAYLWHDAIRYVPVSELWQPQMIPALRAHTVHTIDPGHLVGLVSAPSFHTAADVMLIATAWRYRAIRALLVPLNLAMLLSIPVEGTHYLIDMILGAAVALFALWSAPKVLALTAALLRRLWPDDATASRSPRSPTAPTTR